MLEIRLNCENCNKPLPAHSAEAMICSYECTFCRDCVQNILENICPNCGGGFENRPVRPKEQLTKFPPSTNSIYQPVDQGKLLKLKRKYKDIPANER